MLSAAHWSSASLILPRLVGKAGCDQLPAMHAFLVEEKHDPASIGLHENGVLEKAVLTWSDEPRDLQILRQKMLLLQLLYKEASISLY